MCKEERELYILKMFGRSLTHCGKKESGGYNLAKWRNISLI
jgi:hypothetical protein